METKDAESEASIGTKLNAKAKFVVPVALGVATILGAAAAAYAAPRAEYKSSAAVTSAEYSQQDSSKDSTYSITIPGGTILPVRLNTSISSARSKANDRISATLMQDVTLPNGAKIRKGARVTGHVVEAVAGSATDGGKLVLQFDRIRMRDGVSPIRVNLRAIAGFMAVLDAQTPDTGADRGTPSNWWNLTPVGGGETAYGVGGPVIDDTALKVGHFTSDGVVARPRASDDGSCRADVEGNESPQSLWLFSTKACGVYGLDDVRIVRAGRSTPQGRIELATTRGPVKLAQGTGMLLRVQSAKNDQT